MKPTFGSSRWVAAPLLVSLLLAGCTAFTGHDEYIAYRRVRLAPDERARLIAMQQYAEHHPGGNWIAEIQAARSEREDALWTRSASTREGLEWYLRVYPDGRYVDQARPRLAALEHVAETAAQQAQAERDLRQRQRDEAAEARRTWVTRAVQYWTRTMVGLRGYGRSLRRIAGSNPDFAQAFGRAPEPVCERNQYCIKHYGQLYHIPVPGSTRIDRRVDVYLRLTMDSGRLNRAEILLPGKGFSRWYEMENHQIVTDEDEQQRFQAINWALERIQPIIQEVAQGAESIDVLPEPVAPLQSHQEAADTDEAPPAPDEEPPAVSTEPPAVPEEGGEGEAPPEGNGELDDLLSAAAGPDAEEGQEQATPDPAETEVETMVVPIGLLAYRYRDLQITVLAAGADDYGQAYDGVIIERIQN